MSSRNAKRMTVIGLTGSIGMGKSTVAKLLHDIGFPVYSADLVVHSLLRRNGRAVAPTARAFPDSFKRGAIDRAVLGKYVFDQPQRLRELESIIHPLLRAEERKFLQKARLQKKPAAILEIPLLFETGADTRCDLTFCVTAPRLIQAQRVLARPGMDEKKFKAILKRQMPDRKKRERADYVIPTGNGLSATQQHVLKLLAKLNLLP